uniref:Uncharacterized protein n=1 Tax=Amphimedon queenslandica TaxID=400682 RepID=A0A1X7T768_AMPQE
MFGKTHLIIDIYTWMSCAFPLFPMGKFGEYYHRNVKLIFAEYIKFRILSEDLRYRLCHFYLFYYLKSSKSKS